MHVVFLLIVCGIVGAGGKTREARGVSQHFGRRSCPRILQPSISCHEPNHRSGVGGSGGCQGHRCSNSLGDIELAVDIAASGIKKRTDGLFGKDKVRYPTYIVSQLETIKSD